MERHEIALDLGGDPWTVEATRELCAEIAEYLAKWARFRAYEEATADPGHP